MTYDFLWRKPILITATCVIDEVPTEHLEERGDVTGFLPEMYRKG